MNDEADYRTARAIPGLLKIFWLFLFRIDSVWKILELKVQLINEGVSKKQR